MKTLTIQAKQSNTGSIHDIRGDYDRDINFKGRTKYAVVHASYYGGKGYTTHQSIDNAIARYKASNLSSDIIDIDGNVYDINDDCLRCTHNINDM